MKNIFLLIVFLYSMPAFGCSCAPITTREVYDLADSVFVAMATSLKLYESADKSSDKKVRSEFEVVKVFKGDPKRIQYIEAGTIHSACTGAFLYPGEYYLVFAGQSSTPFLGFCSKSRHIKNEQDVKNTEPYEGYNNEIRATK